MSTTLFWYREVSKFLVVYLALQPMQMSAGTPAGPAHFATSVHRRGAPTPGIALAPAKTSPSISPVIASTAPQAKAANPADPADPYIVAQAKALNNDPTQIFAFVRDQIRFESYTGSVRGARGALWSKGANSLDRASLLIALLGASGISAQYVQGGLDFAATFIEIGGAFPPPTRALGCLPPGTPPYDPRNDGTVYGDAFAHFWVEFGAGN
ncbi:MAG: hypothetical protein M3Z36_10870, partial [Acidobacteriota bacterium]|nr:hypothetical protein [Acidobacteriota bacterium]